MELPLSNQNPSRPDIDLKAMRYDAFMAFQHDLRECRRSGFRDQEIRERFSIPEDRWNGKDDVSSVREFFDERMKATTSLFDYMAGITNELPYSFAASSTFTFVAESSYRQGLNTLYNRQGTSVVMRGTDNMLAIVFDHYRPLLEGGIFQKLKDRLTTDEPLLLGLDTKEVGSNDQAIDQFMLQAMQSGLRQAVEIRHGESLAQAGASSAAYQEYSRRSRNLDEDPPVHSVQSVGESAPNQKLHDSLYKLFAKYNILGLMYHLGAATICLCPMCFTLSVESMPNHVL